MLPTVPSECIECLQLAGKKKKRKIFRFVLFKTFRVFFYLFILIQEKTSKFSQTVAVSLGCRNNLIKASPFKKEGEERGKKEKPSQTSVTSFQPQIYFTPRLYFLDSLSLQWFLPLVHATRVGIHNTNMETRQ